VGGIANGGSHRATRLSCLCIAYTLGSVMFDWDRNNLRKIHAHQIEQDEVAQAPENDPIPMYEQDVGREPRFVYYGETNAGRLLAVVLTERGERIRVVTAYDLDRGQKRDYLNRRMHGELAK
jgi:uncharacterized protein